MHKNKNIKKHLAVNFESLADKITENLDSHKWEDFHKFLRTYVDIFSKNVYAATDYTYKHLKRIIKDLNPVLVSGEKESCVVIMNKCDYQSKMQQLIIVWPPPPHPPPPPPLPKGGWGTGGGG